MTDWLNMHASPLYMVPQYTRYPNIHNSPIYTLRFLYRGSSLYIYFVAHVLNRWHISYVLSGFDDFLFKLECSWRGVRSAILIESWLPQKAAWRAIYYGRIRIDASTRWRFSFLSQSSASLSLPWGVPWHPTYIDRKGMHAHTESYLYTQCNKNSSRHSRRLKKKLSVERERNPSQAILSIPHASLQLHSLIEIKVLYKYTWNNPER